MYICILCIRWTTCIIIILFARLSLSSILPIFSRHHLSSQTMSFPAPITVTVSNVDSTANYLPGSDISLQCSWDTSVYYVAWYKNGVLIYEEDLAASSVLMGPAQGISVDSNFTKMMSTLTIDNAALNDNGNYTCAVTCGAKGVEFGMIAGNLQDMTEVFVSGK